jgi:hypothetical protein
MDSSHTGIPPKHEEDDDESDLDLTMFDSEDDEYDIDLSIFDSEYDNSSDPADCYHYIEKVCTNI